MAQRLKKNFFHIQEDINIGKKCYKIFKINLKGEKWKLYNLNLVGLLCFSLGLAFSKFSPIIFILDLRKIILKLTGLLKTKW